MRATSQARPHRIIRSDGSSDQLTRQQFNSYDAAYDALATYYGDFCCSDDDRIDYTITALPDPAGGPEP